MDALIAALNALLVTIGNVLTSEEVLSAVTLVVTLAITYACREAIAWFKANTKARDMEMLKSGAATVVRFMEQLGFTDRLFAEGARKKEYALSVFTQWAADHGLDVSESEIDALLEEAVNRMKADFSAQPPAE